MTAIAETRQQAVDTLSSETHAAPSAGPLDRSALAIIKESSIHLTFDPEAGTCKTMQTGVKTR